MRHRVLLVAASLLTASASVYGQAKLTGKWQTDNVPAALEAQKNAAAQKDAPAEGGGRPRRRRTGDHAGPAGGRIRQDQRDCD